MGGPGVEAGRLGRGVKGRAEPCAGSWRSFVFAGPAESVTWAQRATMVSPAIQFTSAFAVESFFEVVSAFLYARASLKTSLGTDRKSTRLNSSHLVISYAVFCLKKKKNYSDLTLLLITE